MSEPNRAREVRPVPGPGARRRATTRDKTAPERKAPRDQQARDRLVTVFDRNFLVEAGAGSGKTQSLANRMAAGIAAGAYRVEEMAAVTFTRKAAAELRGRFRLALEQQLLQAATPEARQRIEDALSGIERLVAGTIHAFCAHLLRERPIDAGLAPGFAELDDLENVRLQQRAWRDHVAAAQASGVAPMLDLLEAGCTPKDLYDAFAKVCEHEDVEFDLGGGEPPDLRVTLDAVEVFWKKLSALEPKAFHPDSKCKVQAKCDEFDGRLANLLARPRLAWLNSLFAFWGHPEVTMCWWAGNVGRDASYGYQARDLVREFNQQVVDPFLAAWRAYVHGCAMRVLVQARDEFAAKRRRDNTVNYVDLLMRTSAMLRDRADVRRALQQKYRWLFVDEFQDTDPIQAEIFLMLAAEGNGSRSADPFTLPLRPGALFVVGDPKQSIFRFRRADIDIYLRVKHRIEATGGQVLSLTANFRSLPGVCALANTVFPPLFAKYTAPHSPEFEALDAVRDESEGGPGPRVARLSIPDGDKDDRLADETAKVAAFIKGEVAAGRRKHGDFLVLTRQRTRLGIFAEALDQLEIPVEVTGAGMFCKSAEVRALALVLSALADPLDSVSLVGVLRGPMFGLSDPELFQYRQAGGRFELMAPLPESKGADDAAALDERFGPVLPAMRRLRALWRLTRQLPLAAAVERVLEETGWLALASTTPGGARAGHLLQAVDRVREVVEDGGGLSEAADVLADDAASNDAEALPLRPGQGDVVHLMNLHKAKGLEAPVVILADAGGAFDFPVTLRVVRDGANARGHLRIVNGPPYRPVPVGEPADWAAHEAEELRYCEAERLRLLYVAGTRAKELLVVCRLDAPAKNKAWGAFEGYLAKCGEVKVAPVKGGAKAVKPDLSAETRAEAEAARQAKHSRATQASWAVATPTGAQSRLAMPDRARRAADDAAAAGAVPDTPSGRVDAGAAWGTLLHGLLEHAMRHPGATRADLARLALWLTVESTDLRAFVPEALDVVEAVSKATFWQEARESGEVCVEVPFAVRLAPGETLPGMGAVDRPTVLRGVIDLAHRSGVGWRVVDYKTDRLDGVVDVEAEMLARHGVQLGQYRFAWERVTEREVKEARVVAVRGGGAKGSDGGTPEPVFHFS